MAMFYLKRLEKIMLSALSTPPFKPPASYEETKALAKGVIGYGNNMGEGWLLTAEMLELAKKRLQQHHLRAALRLPAQPYSRARHA